MKKIMNYNRKVAVAVGCTVVCVGVVAALGIVSVESSQENYYDIEASDNISYSDNDEKYYAYLEKKISEGVTEDSDGIETCEISIAYTSDSINSVTADIISSEDMINISTDDIKECISTSLEIDSDNIEVTIR